MVPKMFDSLRFDSFPYPNPPLHLNLYLKMILHEFVVFWMIWRQIYAHSNYVLDDYEVTKADCFCDTWNTINRCIFTDYCLTVNTEISVLNTDIPCYIMVSKDSSKDKYTETNSNKQTIATLVSYGQT